ncbi:MAG: hypothetical protein ABSG13_24410 [Bryobacteraceae bacterium]
MPISEPCESQWIALQSFGRVLVGVTLAAAAFAAQPGPAPRPQGFGSPTPVPSSFWLLLAGLIGVVGWNWGWNRWRSRSRGQQASRD